MPEFPINSYLQAFQQKYANEQANQVDMGQVLSNIAQGGNIAMAEMDKQKEVAKQRVWEGYQQYTKDKKLVSVTNTKEEAPLDAVMQVNNMVATGKYKMKGEKDGSLIIADSKGNPLYKWITPGSAYGTVAAPTVPAGYEADKTDEKGNITSVKKVEDEAERLRKAKAEAQAKAEGTLAGSSGGGTVDKMVFEQENKLRDDFRKDTGSYITIRDAFTRIRASAEEPSATGDLALIYSYMKMQDPTSVVRESEFAQAASAGSYGDRIQAAVKRGLKGERLSDDVRKDFVDRANKLYSKAEKQYLKIKTDYSDRAKDYGLNVKRVIPEYDIESNGDDTPQVLSEEDKQAIAWAEANPNDPRAKKILSLHGR